MEEIQQFRLRMAIKRCYDVESTGRPDSGCYYGESDRRFFGQLNRDGFILSEPTQGKLHWLSFRGFGPQGRNLYLKPDGTIRDEYVLR